MPVELAFRDECAVLMLNRLEPSGTDAEFHYREAS